MLAEISAEKNILLVEDQEPLRVAIAEILEGNDSSYRIHQAASGEEALKLIGEGLKPQLVLLDLSMPGMSGIELAGILKNNPKTAQVEQLYVTASSPRIGLRERLALVTGLNTEELTERFINKPFENTDLRKRIDSLLYPLNKVS